MKTPSEHQALQQTVSRIAEFLDVPAAVKQQPSPPADLLANIGPFTFVIGKASSSAASIFTAVDRVRRAASATADAVPLVAVPYMGPIGQEHCQNAGVNWLDLSGNARIIAPGLRILIEGKPNRFKTPGRPSSVFAPKSSRIARWFLMHPNHPISQRELALATGLGEGFTSRIVTTLLKNNLVLRESNGTLRVPDPNRLLDAWEEVHDFSRHRILEGHVPARSSEALLSQLAEDLTQHKQPYAATGLAAAWLMTHFAAFRIVTMYLPEEPAPGLLQRIAFHEDSRGANVWLVVPNDEGVFQGATEVDGVQCVHPVQIYLDLKGHPERAEEAASRLRSEKLRWRAHAG